ncbi:MAG TPA: hypothetical protein VJ927_10890 [Actinomycetota bacterium]|nr:hypothetical protein [Actinomycetota bacterium]
MTITTTKLTRAAGICAVLAGAIFIGVQIGHPDMNPTSITTTEVVIRNTLKVLMCALAVAGITGMYVSQVRRNGTVGLIGYALLAAGYLLIMSSTYATAYVLPEVAGADPSFARDFIAASKGDTPVGDIGTLGTMISLQGFAYLAGGLLFGIALYRARVLARWAAVLLAVGGVVSVALSMMPDAFYRLLAFPNGIAMIGLGYSLWREKHIVIPEAIPSVGTPDLESAGV